MKVLERALVLAEPQGYIRLFLDEGAPLVALLRQASACGVALSYLLRLLAACGEQVEADEHQQTPSPNSLLEPLTPRERGVLELLMQGASNCQMARDLVLSVGTIKKYVYTICGKLRVRSRTQAVVKARMLHLL
jgi:LuxR family maltose regulon positive regulatory protein